MKRAKLSITYEALGKLLVGDPDISVTAVDVDHDRRIVSFYVTAPDNCEKLPEVAEGSQTPHLYAMLSVDVQRRIQEATENLKANTFYGKFIE